MPNYQINISMDDANEDDVRRVADEIFEAYAEEFNVGRGNFYMRAIVVKAGGLFGFNTGWRPTAGARAAAGKLLMLRKDS